MKQRQLGLVVFDFDGVIADSEPVHFESFRRVLERRGLDLSWLEYQQRYLAYTDREALVRILSDRGRPAQAEQIEQLIREKQRDFARVMPDHCRPLAGVPELLANLRDQRIACGICSGAIRQEIATFLRQAELEGFFAFIVAAEDVVRGKPDPQGYRLCLQKAADLGGFDGSGPLPGECLAVEDSIGGIQAAKAAGMACLAVTGSYPADQLGLADRIVEDLSGVNTAFLRQIVGQTA
ncbi:MAG: HAD family phosphatase [Sedimentisphaerales bacterium]|nr:HAD family phosphatase [Sedimentisphaerales bacterium]